MRMFIHNAQVTLSRFQHDVCHHSHKQVCQDVCRGLARGIYAQAFLSHDYITTLHRFRQVVPWFKADQITGIHGDFSWLYYDSASMLLSHLETISMATISIRLFVRFHMDFTYYKREYQPSVPWHISDPRQGLGPMSPFVATWGPQGKLIQPVSV